MDLKSLLDCQIQNLEHLTINRQCDEIVKRVVLQLMTPGSIKVLADNLANGTFHDANKKEAAFLYRLINYKKETALHSESGTFYIDCQGIVQRFEPATDNQ